MYCNTTFVFFFLLLFVLTKVEICEMTYWHGHTYDIKDPTLKHQNYLKLLND